MNLTPTVVNLQQAFKLALSIVLLYWLALSLDWDLPKYGALAIALISLDTSGASLSKGIMRIAGTTIGLAVGLLGLSLFVQDSWPMLGYQAGYLVIVGYFMQSSRYPYAWFVAGFLSPLVWATTYGKIDNAFSYATFRYLETTAGIVIYTVVCAIIWPRTAGDALNRQGRDFWQQFQEMFATYRLQLRDGHAADDALADASAKRAKLAGATSMVFSTLAAAYADTPSVAKQKRVWESLRVNIRVTGNAMEVWQQSIDDCRHLDMDRVLPHVDASLERLSQRLARIAQLWQARSSGKGIIDSADGDEVLLDRPELEPASKLLNELSCFDRAALLNFEQQLNSLHETSIELLQAMRVLARVDTVKAHDLNPLPKDPHQGPLWDASRFSLALVPSVSFIAGWFFWIYFNPPTGPTIPSMAATFGLMVVMTPMRVLVLVPPSLIAMCGFVAPIYFFVMPRLSTGPELLSLIFVLVFAVSAMLVGRLSLLKTLILAFFVMMTGISNDQNYSFAGLASGAQMLLLSMFIVGIVQVLISPPRSERVLLDSVRRFFLGCARITGGYARDGSRENTAAQARRRRNRKRYFQTMVLPAAAMIQAAHKRLDDNLYPDNSPEKVQRLTDAFQNISCRLQALEVAQHRWAEHALEPPESFTRLTTGVQAAAQTVFESWARLETGDVMEYRQSELQQLARDLEQQLDDLKTSQGQLEYGEQLLRDLYFVIGTTRGLIDAMANTQVVINEINWQQWATSRF